MVGKCRRVSAVRPIVRRLQRRRQGRSRWHSSRLDHLAGPRGRCNLAQPVLSVAPAGSRVRHVQLLRHRTGLRHARRVRPARDEARAARDQGPDGCGAEPLQLGSPVVRQGVDRGQVGSNARDVSISATGEGPNGDEPPNNWMSIFGGSDLAPRQRARRCSRPVVPRTCSLRNSPT